MVALYILVGVLAAVVLCLLAKICSLRRAARELAESFVAHLAADTNTLMDISCRDRHMLRLAATLNEQLRLLREQQLRYLNGDRELKDAVTNISHDLRTPLTAICGYLDLLGKEEKSPDVLRYLGFISNRVEAMKQLTEELFRYSVILSSQGELKSEPILLNGALEESIAAFYAALTARGITPDIHMTETPVHRKLDRAALARVFENILNNALKYSDGDLEITLSDCGEVTFTNTAAGLDGVQVGKLFDRFFSVEAARNSTGLGLAIAKTLVEQMGGTVAATYADGRLSVHVVFGES